MAGIKAVAFDKTGTLTAGRPQVTDIVPLNGTHANRVLAVAAALERYSEHPLARAIMARAEGAAASPAQAEEGCVCGCAEEPAATAPACACEEVKGDCSAPAAGGKVDPAATLAASVERFRAIAGKGVRAALDGRLHYVGRPELLGAHAADPALQAALTELERQGKTAVVVGDEDGALGVIAVSDPLRAGAAQAVAELRGLGVAEVVMLTGDNPKTAAAVAAQAGIGDVRAGLLPADKVAAIAELRERAGAVAMVGDGVNDAPALAAASLGVAMGAAGTDAALETADIALMGDDLAAVPATVRLARRTTRVIWQNIVFSIVVKAVFLVLAPLGLVSLWLAVFADMGTSLLVTANGLRLYRR
jgi:Cd2+/Zn2+-exporting ATPase